MDKPHASNILSPLVGVVIVNYNGLKFINECLESLSNSDYPNTIVYMVDNASSDGSIEHVEQNYPWVHVIPNSRNYLFAKGANIGIQKALSAEVDYIFLLNPDVTLTTDCVSKLVDFLSASPFIGACQPKLLFKDRPTYIQSCGCRCSLSGRAWDHRMGEKDDPHLPPAEEVLGVTGGALFIRSSVWSISTGFCEAFGMYYEDIDLCLRLRTKGLKLVCLNTAVAYHVFSGIVTDVSSSKKVFFTERNCYWVVLRNFPIKKIFHSYIYSIPIGFAMVGINLVKRRYARSVYSLLGLFIGVGSLILYLPVLFMAFLSKKRTYSFWSFIDDDKILPPPPAGINTPRHPL